MNETGETFSSWKRNMTLGGKFCASRTSSLFYRAVFNLSRFALIGLLTLGCKTTQAPTEVSRTAEQKEELKNQLQATKLVECKMSSAEWVIPGDVGQAQMIRDDGKWSLIYEALLRSGPRTVYQPLQRNLSFDGDGIAMGLRGAPKVSDLKTFEDSNRNRWFASRVKVGSSELFSGLVEVLVNGKRHSTVLPIPSGESVQQIWVSQPIVSNQANVIVRSTPAIDGSVEQMDDSTFRWYQVGHADNSARLMSTYKPKKELIQPAGFVAMEKTGEPVAVSIVQPLVESADAEPVMTNSTSKISLFRIFSRTPSERVIFSGQGNLTSLNYSDSTFFSGLYLSWIFSPPRGGVKYLQMASMPIRFIPERYFGRGPLKELEAIYASELSYEANSPDFSFTTNNQNQVIPLLSWWGKLDSDVALMVQLITPAFKQSRNQVLKTVDGAALGISFQPSLGIVPPKQFNRIMSFTASPAASENNIIILSNRGDSAEIAKETNLYPCLF